MSYPLPPTFSGAAVILGTDPNDANAPVDLTGDATIGSFNGFLVGDPGSASPPEIELYLRDGRIMRIRNVQIGVPYMIPIRGVVSVSAGMTEVWGLIA